MAGASDNSTQVDDVIVPEVFTPYVQQITEEKARLIQSGVLSRSPLLDEKLNGGGLTFNFPSWRDLDNDDENISTDDLADRIAATVNGAGGWDFTGLDSTPNDTSSDQEIAVRLNRNNSWNTADLASALAGDDPAGSIASRVGFYWTRRLQALFIATWQGVSRDNAANDAADYMNDISGGTGGSFTDGVTNFSAEGYLDAKLTMGDSMGDLAAIMVHSVVFNRMQKNNLIDFIPDARGEVQIPTFLGAEVIVDDGMPNGLNSIFDDGATGEAGVYESWLFGMGAAAMGVGSAKVPTEVERQASSGNGGGSETLHSRVEWCMHPVGHAYTGTSPNGGPGNGTGANNLNNASSWDRILPERKMIKFAKLITREA